MEISTWHCSNLNDYQSKRAAARAPDGFILPISGMIRIHMEDDKMAAHWFLVQFKPNAQNVANRNLGQQGFETFLPLLEVTRRHGSRFVRQLRPLFPGYMFIHLDPDVAPWRKVNSTQGVSRIVQFNDAPATVPQGLVERLRARCDDSGYILSTETIAEGQTLEIVDGPFSSFVGTVEKIDSQNRIWLLLEFMSQGMRIHLNRNQVIPR